MSCSDSQPSNKTWELSLYELHRSPQEVITDNTEIAVSPRSLHSELMCPICLDMLKNTMTTKECLHRFCQECIITALRSGNKECPTCRKKLVSKRSLRPDPNFDMLIAKIYPCRDEYEAHQDRIIQTLNKQHSQALAHTIEEGMRMQAMNRAQRIRKQATEEANNASGITNPSNGTPNHTGAGAIPEKTSITNGIGSTGLTNTPVVGTTNPPTINGVPNTVLIETPPNITSTSGSCTPIRQPTPTSNLLSSSDLAALHPRKKPKTHSENDSTCSGMDQDMDESVSMTGVDGGESLDCIPQDPEGEGSSETTAVNEIELVFKPHPIEMEDVDPNLIQVRYIKTTANATVDHLSKYLAMRLSLDKQQAFPNSEPLSLNPFFIYIAVTPGQFLPLNGNQSLDQVNEKYWKVNKPLEMYYSYKINGGTKENKS